MTRIPHLKGKELVRILERIGFEILRTRGSHVFLKHADGRVTTVPVHAGETVGPGLCAPFSGMSSCPWMNCFLLANCRSL